MTKATAVCDGVGVIATMPYDSDYGTVYEICPGCQYCRQDQPNQGERNTMTSPDFVGLLDMDAEDAVRPRAMPGGSYRALVKGSESIKSREDTDGIKFTLSDFEPLADVDVPAWEEYLAYPTTDPNNITMSNNSTTFWLTRKAMFMLKDFCVACGSEETGPMNKLVAQAMQQKVVCKVAQSVSRDGKGVFNTIEGYSKDE